MISVFRENRLNIFRHNLPSDESGLMEGLVFGQKSGISRMFFEKIRRAGVSHIVVASGYNIMLVAGLVMGWLFWILKRKPATIVVLVILFLYTMICGSQAPVLRAWWMAAVTMVGISMGRVSGSLWALGVSCWLMYLIEPNILMDIGFQLSVAACIGLMWLDPIIRKFFSRFSRSNWLEILGVRTSVSTLIVASPILLWHFGKLSLIGILSNILILPVVPILTILGFAMAGVGGIATLPVYALAHYLVVVINWFGV